MENLTLILTIAINQKVTPMQQHTAITEADMQSLAAAETLLVAMDFDGTLAPFTDNPLESRAESGALEALQAIAQQPGTTAMMLSGRNVEQLRAVTGLTDNTIRLVGSHGAEDAEQGSTPLTDEQQALYARLEEAAELSASLHPDLWVERKPRAVCLHTRKVENPDVAEQAQASYLLVAQQLDNASITQGKAVVEVAVDSTTKGDYLADFVRRNNISRVVFAGDDTTDESVFRVLRYEAAGDLGIKVGAGQTKANRRLTGTREVRDFLRELADTLALSRRGDA